METIAIINRKGGSGKTVTAANLGATLQRRHGKRVLFVDLDQQGNLTHYFKGKTDNATIFEVLTGQTSVEQSLEPVDYGQIITADTALAQIEGHIQETVGLQKLRQELAKVADRFDLCILDCPPALNGITLSALMAADSVIIPSLASIFSLKGIESLNNAIRAIKKAGNPDLKISGILLTQYDGRNNLSRNIRQYASEMAQVLNTRLFDTTIRRTVRVDESILSQQALIDFAPRCSAQADYERLALEVLHG